MASIVKYAYMVSVMVLDIIVVAPAILGSARAMRVVAAYDIIPMTSSTMTTTITSFMCLATKLNALLIVSLMFASSMIAMGIRNIATGISIIVSMNTADIIAMTISVIISAVTFSHALVKLDTPFLSSSVV